MADQIVSAGEMCDASATDSGKGAKVAALSPRRYPTKFDARQLPRASPSLITRNGSKCPRGGCTAVEPNNTLRYHPHHLPKEFKTRPALHRVIQMMPRRFLHN